MGRAWGIGLFCGNPACLFVAACEAVARVSLGMSGLALVLLVRQAGGAYGPAGGAAAAFTLGIGVAAVVWSRMADRLGARVVVGGTAVAQFVALLAGLAVVDVGQRLSALVVVAVVVGALHPPLGSVMRSVWSHRLPDQTAPTPRSPTSR